MNDILTGPPSHLIDVVFPGDTNHHGTLFGGIGLGFMDRIAFIAAARHARADFVTASSERIDFIAPARLGDIVEVTGRIVRIGRRSMSVEAELVAEAPLTGERRLCARGRFNMVAVGEAYEEGAVLPPLIPQESAPAEPNSLRVADVVFPDQTSHYGSLYGGDALAGMAKAAFVLSTRICRQKMVMASCSRGDFESHIHPGEIVECCATLEKAGRTSVTIAVELFAEPRGPGKSRHSGTAEFVMVAVEEDGRPVNWRRDGS